jgi:hypothetical protein
MKLTRILPKIMAEITRHPRYQPEIKWSENFWTHNIFRLWEVVFWRRYGPRREITATRYADGTSEQFAHSWEGTFALIEVRLRYFLSWRPSPVRLQIVILRTPEGLQIPIPYLFAIARPDSPGDSTPKSTDPYSYSHTVSGTDTYMLCWNTTNTSATTTSGITYASVALSSRQSDVGVQTGSSRAIYMFSLHAPTTGTNTLEVDLSGAPGAWSKAVSVSYTGVDQSTDFTTVHNSNKTVGTAVSTVSPTVTVNVANSILATNFDAAGSDGTASTNAQEVLDPSDGYHEPIIFENSSLTGQAVGSQSMTITFSISGVVCLIAALAPSGGAAPATIVVPTLLYMGAG